METPYDWLVKICINCYGHMTKMAPSLYMVKTFKISPSLEPKCQWHWDLLCSIDDVIPTRYAQMMNLG